MGTILSVAVGGLWERSPVMESAVVPASYTVRLPVGYHAGERDRIPLAGLPDGVASGHHGVGRSADPPYSGSVGGYTTFSTLTYETAAMFQEGEWRRAGFYALGSLVLGLVELIMGMAAADALLRRPG